MSMTAQLLSTTLATMHFALVAGDMKKAKAASKLASELAGRLLSGCYE
ncbi:hypothetical protein ACUXQ2_005699 [Cupriavidus metallidurans]|nr:hypothetical protein [Cupriavidus metallidurans]